MSNTTNNPNYTDDTLLGGRVKIRQPKHGYRVSQDAVLLAALTTLAPTDRVLELGTGYGQVALCLATLNPNITITAVELLPEVAELAQFNITNNGMQDRISLLTKNVKNLHLGQLHDLAVFNPPYRDPNRHTLSHNKAKNYANYYMDGVTLTDWLATARRLAARTVFIHHWEVVEALHRANPGSALLPLQHDDKAPPNRGLLELPAHGHPGQSAPVNATTILANLRQSHTIVAKRYWETCAIPPPALSKE